MFKYIAKISHKIYGQTKYPAQRLNDRNSRIIYPETITNTTSAISAARVICNPKKKYDHNAFNTIWVKNNEYAGALD